MNTNAFSLPEAFAASKLALVLNSAGVALFPKK
jgi:hypothetical protein